MGFIFDAVLLELALGIVLIFCLFYIYSTFTYSYWKNRSIPYEKPSFPFGTVKELVLFRQPISIYYQRMYNKFKDQKAVGMFELNKPFIMVKDTELIRKILIKDFHHFVDRGLLNPDNLTPVNRHLFNMEGDPWRVMRNKLTPAFTSGKMKMMFCLMEACCNEFIKALEPIAGRNEKFDVKNFLACLTTDVIASCAFGLQSNSIQNPSNEFRVNGNKAVGTLPLWQIIKFWFSNAYPRIFKILPVGLITNGTDDFFMNLVEETVAYREKTGLVRNDFVDILIKIKNNKCLHDEEENGNVKDARSGTNVEPGLTLEEMAAQALLFLTGGFESSSTTMTFCLYEISVNKDVQVKMRKEVDEVLEKNSGKPSYKALQDMTYLEAVINETLRRYPALSILHRLCTEEYKVPELNLLLPKDMKVVIPVYAIHHDPERFTDNKIQTRNNFTFMPFGEGPRMCIGNRFAMLQMKLCLSMLIHNYELSFTQDTPVPLPLCKKSFLTSPATPISLKISKRTY